jgi:hypothetical protein
MALEGITNEYDLGDLERNLPVGVCGGASV